MKWVKFTRVFNFTPKKKLLAGMQWSAGTVDGVTDEAADQAIAEGRAFEIEPPKNAEEAAKMKAGQLEPVAKKAAAEKPAGDHQPGAPKP